MKNPAYPLRGLRLWLWLACADALAGRGETTDSRTYRVWLWFIVRAAVVEWEGYDSGPDADRGEAPF